MEPNDLSVEYPEHIAQRLARRLEEIPERARQTVLELLVPALRENDPTLIELAMQEIERRLLADLQSGAIETQSATIGTQVTQNHARKFFPAIAKAAGVILIGRDGEAGIPLGKVPSPTRRRPVVLGVRVSANPMLLADRFARENARLIRSLSAEVIPALRDEVIRVATNPALSVEQGAERLAKKWAKSGVPVANGNLAPRVRQIVANQVSRLNTDIAQARQQAAGVRQFKWISRRDGRVRPLHRQIDDGRVFDWAKGHSTEGLPGQPPGCRCFAEAVVTREAILQGPGFVQLANLSGTMAA